MDALPDKKDMPSALQGLVVPDDDVESIYERNKNMSKSAIKMKLKVEKDLERRL